MIGLLLALTLAELPPQTLAPGQCAMFLWDRGRRQRIAMWTAAGPLTLALTDGPAMLAPEPGSGSGTPVLGLLPEARFSGVAASAALDVSITPDTTGKSATISEGVLTLTEPGGEALVIPVAGLIGCG